MLRNQSDYQQSVSERNQRISQLNVEIQEEKRKDNPDAFEIGTRSVEIEMTCRELSKDARSWGEKNLELLTGAQKTKLKVLEDAIKLAPTIANAQSLGLLPGTSGISFASTILVPNPFLGVTTATPVFTSTGCPTQLLRSGSFGSSIGPLF